MTQDAPLQIERLLRFGLTTGDADRLADFYHKAFGCRPTSRVRHAGADFEQLMGVRGGADGIVMALGDETIEILAYDQPGRPYPEASSARDTIFQHFAIVVDDMGGAYAKLCGLPDWRPISTEGPQRLPQSAGGVTAFKFRDPDGHPLELLAFPSDAAPARWRSAGKTGAGLGIDHSAISVADPDASIAFYHDLGCRMSARTLNEGSAQHRLDDVQDPLVDVITILPPHPAPHIELLGYRGAPRSFAPPCRANDIAATTMIMASTGNPTGDLALPAPRRLHDPDGHALLILAPDPVRDLSVGG